MQPWLIRCCVPILESQSHECLSLLPKDRALVTCSIDFSEFSVGTGFEEHITATVHAQVLQQPAAARVGLVALDSDYSWQTSAADTGQP